jgi:Domain of unknown function (DUF4383)
MATTDHTADRMDRTPAQWYSLIFGLTLLIAGIAGFFADASFGDLGSDVQGDDLIVFEVNGWHNLVHIASGVLGLALAGTPPTARLYALGFGAVYLAVTIWGLIDGNDVLGLLPVNGADNVLHIAIAVTGILAGLASDPRRDPTLRGESPRAA